MAFVIFGQQELDQLGELATKYFSDIANYNTEHIQYKELPFDQTNLGNFYKVKTVKDKHKLDFQWYVEDLEPLYKNNPSHYISHLLGHEGENSLLSILIKQGLAQELVSGSTDFMHLFSVIQISIELTQKGFENYKQVCDYVFKYLQILREKGVQHWVFEELQSLRQFQFDFKEKEKPGMQMANLADNLFRYPVEHVLVNQYLMEQYNPEELQRIISKLGTKNLMLLLESSHFEDKELELQEPIYSTKYSKEKLGIDILDMFLKPCQSQEEANKLDLPVKNNFIPKHFETIFIVLKNEQENQFPIKLLENNFSEVWHKQDNNFFTPKALYILKLFTNDIGYLLNYLAIVANLIFGIDIQFNGIRISLQGYNDSMEPYLYEILSKLTEFHPEQHKDDFLNIYEKYRKEYENVFKDNSYQLAFHYLNILTVSNAYSFDLKELQKELNLLTFERFCELMNYWFKQLRAECIYIGNLDSTQTKRIATTIEQIFQTKIKNFSILPKDQVTKLQAINFPINKLQSYEHIKEDPNEQNSAMIMFFQHEPDDLKAIVLNELLLEIISNNYFQQLRTQQQLGYVVHSGNYVTRGVYGIFFLIQSNLKSGQYLAIKTIDFIKEFYQKLLEYNEDEIEKYKNSLKLQLLEKDTQISQEANKYFSEITKHSYKFNLNQLKVEILEKLQKNDIIEFYDKVLNKEKKLLEIHVIAQNHKEEFDKLKQERNEVVQGMYERIENITDFKKNSALYPDYFAIK